MLCAAVWYYNIRCVLREKVFFFVRSAAIFFAALPRRAQPEGAVLWKEKGDRIMDLKELYDHQRRLVDMIGRQIHEKERNNRMMGYILSHIVEYRNGESVRTC